ncbi:MULTISPECIES: flagellar basal body rod protein FlgG [unclassified Paenibacillus]|uniref:flagellar basal body rod protein FlgG n=1 Tax=unclassified Paenibacillus TaxID=185978 RepID=UPI001AEB1456|nr:MULTISPECIES: flagellar basal body rod protein FlgG [unclassified Paenibacillus]MBP1156002.1 flagellar hook protein FlgE [Paenibacillus sp. PvP091]MBP1168612.1 flagellar hook protein FlgE [Paenibacillus sp. PvR098]MBP2439640.1 flagellar hook protein FlgE [Paenibacillus sp. PvP052]
MLRSLYSGVSGMRGFQTKLDVIGNNIANVNTVGFKASRVMFKDILSQTVSGVTAPTDERGGVNSKQIGLGVAVGAIDTLHTPGSAMTTNVVTDLRIDGDGFFAMRATEDQEQPFLSRAGNFTLDSNRRLVNADGLFVSDSEGGIIQLEDTVTAFSISQSGELITVGEDGAATPSGIFIAVVKVANPAGLEKIGGNLYRVTPNAMPPDALELPTGEDAQANNAATGTGAIISGQLEMSNVDLTSEFTEMIIAQRGFQSNSRIITTSDEILQEVVNLKR